MTTVKPNHNEYQSQLVNVVFYALVLQVWTIFDSEQIWESPKKDQCLPY